jgi:phytoene synthase
MSAVEAAFAACAEITRTQARNFWWGLRLLPEPRRSALYAIYAWMRAADDLVDGTDGADPEELARRVASFRAHTDESLAGQGTGGAVWIALAEVARRFPLEAREFHEMLDGQLADVGEVRCRTWEELRTVCYRVAGTVGVVCVRIWGGPGGGPIDPSAIPLAIDRGIAFQLTNILRDLREDAERCRSYLPLEEYHAAGLTPGDLLAWRDPPACRAFLAAQVERAGGHYRSSEPLEALVDPPCRPTLAAMTGIYRELLARVAADPKRVVLGRRVSVPAWRKFAIAFRARRA